MPRRFFLPSNGVTAAVSRLAGFGVFFCVLLAGLARMGHDNTYYRDETNALGD